MRLRWLIELCVGYAALLVAFLVVYPPSVLRERHYESKIQRLQVFYQLYGWIHSHDVQADWWLIQNWHYAVVKLVHYLVLLPDGNHDLLVGLGLLHGLGPVAHH